MEAQSNLVDVTEDEFFAVLYADPRDIMPSIIGAYSKETGYTSEWRANNGTRTLFGITAGDSTHPPQTYRLVGTADAIARVVPPSRSTPER